MLAQFVEHLQDDLHASQVHAEVVRKMLNELKLADVVQRVPPPLGRGAIRDDQFMLLIDPQRAWVQPQDVGGYAQGENWLIGTDAATAQARGTKRGANLC